MSVKIKNIGNFHNPKAAAWLLRIGLAVVFVYAAAGSLLHPDEWIGYLPSFLSKTAQAHLVLKGFAILEIVLSLWLLSGKYIKFAAMVAAAMFAGIVTSQLSALSVTFRDIGLLFMALGLAVL